MSPRGVERDQRWGLWDPDDDDGGIAVTEVTGVFVWSARENLSGFSFWAR